MIYEVEIICNSLLCLGALAGFVYSLITFFRPKKAMYKKMVGCALGCLFIERLYEIVQYVVAGDIPQLFQIGTFGNIGCFMFLFSANYGAIDSLIDDGSAELKKYRLTALAAPAVTIAAAVAILFSPSDPGRIIACVIEVLFAGASSYYSLKHLIIPKKYSDFLSGMRVFHIMSLVLAVGVTAEDIIWCYQVSVQAIWYIPYTILFVAMVTLAPALERGTKQWRT
ncbi:MAG: hypothetical protein IJJ15_06200 [Ruminococcus sp.]|nr:hypothetical protein [Ruminococcus sp.]